MQTKSERLFESFLTLYEIPFEPIDEVKQKGCHRPDYLVQVNGLKLIFEIKQLSEDQGFGVVSDPNQPTFRTHYRIVGDHVRRRIRASKKQIKYGAEQGIPSILLIYNDLDPLQLWATDDKDFETAMYGELTVLVNRHTGEASSVFNGRNDELQEAKNTSFSAVGRLASRGEKLTVTLFENAYAQVKIPYKQMPECFDVRPVEVDTSPMFLP